MWSWAGHFRQAGAHINIPTKSSEGDLLVVPHEFDEQRDIPNLQGSRSYLRARRTVKPSKTKIFVTGTENSSVLHSIRHKVPIV